MEKIIIGIGTNLGNKAENIREAGVFLEKISTRPIKKASIYETEPVGIADQVFYNTAALIHSGSSATVIFDKIKEFEKILGRNMNAPRWSNRLIDLDIICMGQAVLHNSQLDIPHKSYKDRLFVLKPMQEILSDWIDPESGETISQLLLHAPEMSISKTAIKW